MQRCRTSVLDTCTHLSHMISRSVFESLEDSFHVKHTQSKDPGFIVVTRTRCVCVSSSTPTPACVLSIIQLAFPLMRAPAKKSTMIHYKPKNGVTIRLPTVRSHTFYF